MYDRLKQFLNKHNTFYNYQYGFRERCSTEHAIQFKVDRPDIVNRIQRDMDKGMCSCGVFIDLQKAFNTVDYHILLHKLSHYRIRGVFNKWFCSHLSGRTQITQVGSYIFLKERKPLVVCHRVLFWVFYCFRFILMTFTSLQTN